jgi:hypothetical protein
MYKHYSYSASTKLIFGSIKAQGLVLKCREPLRDK